MFSNIDTFNFFFILRQILVNSNNTQTTIYLPILNDLVTTGINMNNAIYSEMENKINTYL